MPVRKGDPDQVVVIGGDRDDAVRFVESDFLIRSGKCPNGCGPLTITDFGQECTVCPFSTNVNPDREAAQ